MDSIKQLLGLSRSEKVAFDSLTEQPQTVAKLVQISGLPRTTLVKILRRFKERGLCETTRTKTRTLYQQAPPELIARNILPSGALPSGNISIPFIADRSIKIYKGKDPILGLYRDIISQNFSKPLEVIELSESLQYILEATNIEDLNETNKVISKSKSVLDVIVEEDFFERIYQYHPNDFETFLENFLNRAAHVTTIPAGLLDLPNDLFIFKDAAFIVDWKHRVAIEIQNPLVARQFKELFRVVKSLGRKTNYRQLADEFLEKKSLSSANGES